jgi:hypothetical protein
MGTTGPRGPYRKRETPVVDEKPPLNQPGAPDAPGVTEDTKVVSQGGKLPYETSGQQIHSTGKDPDGGQSAEEVDAAVRSGVPPEPVPAPATALLATPGGYQVVPAGIDAADVGSNAVGR